MTDTTWNFRILRKPDGTSAVHEVYYEDGRPTSWTTEPIVLSEFDDPTDAQQTIALLMRAAVDPPLWVYGDRLAERTPPR